MNTSNGGLSVQQLQHAIAIKKTIAKLEKQLAKILGAPSATVVLDGRKKRRKMSRAAEEQDRGCPASTVGKGEGEEVTSVGGPLRSGKDGDTLQIRSIFVWFSGVSGLNGPGGIPSATKVHAQTVSGVPSVVSLLQHLLELNTCNVRPFR